MFKLPLTASVKYYLGSTIIKFFGIIVILCAKGPCNYFKENNHMFCVVSESWMSTLVKG